MMMRLRAAVSIYVLMTGLPLTAVAQQSPEPSQSAYTQTDQLSDTPERNGPGRNALAACRGDMQALCSGVERGGGRKVQCLKENQTKLSQPCQQAIQAVLNKAGLGGPGATAPGTAVGAPNSDHTTARPMQACKADIATMCAGVQKGDGRIAKCLKDNAAGLSSGCQSALAERKAKAQMARRDIKVACETDRHALCPSATKGHESLQCLREKKAQASPNCQQALAQLH